MVSVLFGVRVLKPYRKKPPEGRSEPGYRETDNYIAKQIPSQAVQADTQTLHAEFGDHFSDVLKSITTDNDREFEGFAQVEQWGTNIYFAHPYSSWERPVNERNNGFLRDSPSVSIEKFSSVQLLTLADELNSRTPQAARLSYPERAF